MVVSIATPVPGRKLVKWSSSPYTTIFTLLMPSQYQPMTQL